MTKGVILIITISMSVGIEFLFLFKSIRGVDFYPILYYIF